VFANGAVTAAFARIFGEAASSGGMLGDSDASGNVRDPAVSRAASAAANEALGDSLTTTYGSLDAASAVWSDAVQPVADQFDTEIASKFFQVRGGYRFGRAYSDGIICSKSVQCAVSWRSGGDVRGSLVGYIHTHPSNRMGPFSGGDLYQAWSASDEGRSPFSAYVSLPNRQIWSWSSVDYMRSRAAYSSWDQANNLARRVR